MFYLPVSVWLESKTKSDKSTIPPVNTMLIDISYQFILILGDYVLLGVLNL